jgi:hypothetical protein
MRLSLVNAIIALILLTAFVVPNSDATILDWFYKKNSKVKNVDLNQDNAKPLTWLSDNIIVIGKGASIYLYDIKHETLLERVADSYDESNFQWKNCFTPDASVFAVKSPKIENKNDMIIKSAPAQQSFRYVVDWKQPNTAKYVDLSMWATNELDCTLFSGNDRRAYIKRRNVEDGFVDYVQHWPLLNSIHGESFLFIKKLSQNKYAKYIELSRKMTNVQDTSKDLFKQLRLDYDGMPHGNEIFPNDIESFYDSYKVNYVLYEKTDIFDSKRGVWPLSAWRVTPNLELIERYTLPPGPWVKKHSFLKQISCFSCGCECYSNMKLHGGGGKIYAHIWGKAIDRDEAGIYRLEEIDGKANWSNLFLGNFGNQIIVSPDGCTVVFSDQNNKLKKMEICSFSK